MDLWIRSQDKEVLTKISNLCYMCREDVLHYLSVEDLTDDMEHFVWSPDGAILGTYKTKERALEVLDEIQNILKIGLQINNNNQFVGTTTYIFEMPKE